MKNHSLTQINGQLKKCERLKIAKIIKSTKENKSSLTLTSTSNCIFIFFILMHLKLN